MILNKANSHILGYTWGILTQCEVPVCLCAFIYAILGIWSVISSWKHVSISNVLNTQKLHLSLSQKKQEESYKKTILLEDDCECVFWNLEIISIMISFILLYTIHIYMPIGLVLSFPQMVETWLNNLCFCNPTTCFIK